MGTLTIPNLTPGIQYSIQINAQNGTDLSQWSTALVITASDDSINPNPSDVTGLTGSISGTTFVLGWLVSTTNIDGSPLKDFSHYKINVSNGTTNVNYSTIDTAFSYTLDRNKKDFGVAQGNLTFTVYVIDTSNNSSSGVSIPINVSGPGPVTGIILSALLDAIGVSFNAPTTGPIVDYYEIFFSTNGGVTWISQYTGTSTNVVIPDVNYVPTSVAIDSVSVFGIHTRVIAPTTITPRSTVTTDTTAPAPPNTVTLTEAANAADPSGSTRQITINWTKSTVESDLSGFIVQYRISGTSAWTYVTITDDTARSTVLNGLAPNTIYYIGVSAFDFTDNVSTYTTDISNYPITTGKDTVGPNIPQAPTAVGSINYAKVQIICSGYDNGTPPAILARDLDYFEVYVDTTPTFTPTKSPGSGLNYVGNVIASATPLGVSTPIPSIGTFPLVTARANDTDTSTTTTYYVKIIAVDVNGNSSLASASSAVTMGFIDSLNVGYEAITDANIENLTVTKLIAGTGTVNDLQVYSTLTLGTSAQSAALGNTAPTPGILQSSDYVAGASGFKLAQGSLEIVDGIIQAKALQLQDSQNLIRPDYADFEFPASYYTALDLTGSTVSTDAINFKYHSQSLKIVTTNGSNFVNFGTSPTNYNIDVVGGQPYIMSAWFYQTSSSAKLFSIRAKENSSAIVTTSTAVSVPSGVWTRITFVYTPPTNASSILMGVSCTTIGTTYNVDGIQVEKQMTGSTSPSPWKPPSVTTIDGGMIRTGTIQSNQLTTSGLSSGSQPVWSINMLGGATFSNALIRGHLIVGQAGDLVSDQYIQSYNYSSGNSGWRIDGSGTAEFQNVTARGTFQTDEGLVTGGGVVGISLSTVNADSINFYTGSPLEGQAGAIITGSAVDGLGATIGTLTIVAPHMNHSGPFMQLVSDSSSGVSNGYIRLFSCPRLLDTRGNAYPQWSTTTQVQFDGGRFSGTTSGSGILTIPHAIGSTPTAAVATYDGTATRFCTITSRASGNIFVQVSNDSGATVNGTVVTVNWIAFG